MTHPAFFFIGLLAIGVSHSATGGEEGQTKAPSPAAELQESAEAANKLLAEVAAVYANAESYVDEGLVTTVFYTRDGQRTTLKPFFTAFSRPDKLFRYEFRERKDDVSWGSYIVWAKGDDVQSWWFIKPEIEHPASLQRAIGAAVGVSGGSASRVPTLLVPDPGANPVTARLQAQMTLRLSGPRLLPERDVDGVRCVGITGRNIMGAPDTLWVEKERKLIRLIEEERELPDFRTKTTIAYKPEINVEIPKEKFDLGIPEK